MSLIAHYNLLVRERLERPDFTTEPGVNALLRLLGRWRSKLLANTLVARDGPTVQTGPFAGIIYAGKVTEGCIMPRLLGCYESELHPAIEAFARQGLDAVIDVGCAEGYYAVGLARIMPGTVVHAFDIDVGAQAECAALAEANGVSDRVRVQGEFRGEMFAGFADRSTLVFVDAEGFEDDLLDPGLWPALKGMNLIVETHDAFRPGVCERLIARFSPTHSIERLDNAPRLPQRPQWLKALGHMDQLIAIWEWRTSPTPWLVMTPR